MKLRIGFVSNSSTTSFLLLGYIFGEEDIKKLMDSFKIKYDGEDSYMPLENLSKYIKHYFPNLQYHIRYDHDDHILYFGSILDDTIRPMSLEMFLKRHKNTIEDAKKLYSIVSNDNAEPTMGVFIEDI